MERALRLAEKGRASTHPNPRVGCVVVRDGLIAGEGYHVRAGGPHAEIEALRAAGDRARGADLYVTLEPCSHHGRTPPCADAVIAAGVRRVWAAMRDPNPLVAGRGLVRLRAAGLEVHSGLCGERAAELNRGFLSRHQRSRPWVTLKLAASLDGRTAMASGESQWITGEAARADGHRLRAEAGAVLSSAGTVLADDPQLNARLYRDRVSVPEPGCALPQPREPDRIVLDVHGRVPAGARVWAAGARRFWLTAGPVQAPDGVEHLTVPQTAEGHADLAETLRLLASHDVNEVLVECGPTLAGALLAQRLADELVIYFAPVLLGDEARPLARLPGLARLADGIRMQTRDVRTVGADVRITALLEH